MPRSPDFKRNVHIPDLISDTRKPKLMPSDMWFRVAITENYEASGQTVGGFFRSTSTDGFFENDWHSVVSSITPPASWYTSKNGEVRLRGKVTGGDTETVIFTLPPEARPEYAETFIVATDFGGNATITVRQNGEVYVEAISIV